MLDELIAGFDGSLFCKFLNNKFAGSFSASHHVIPFKKEFGWEKAERLGVVKTLPGPNGANMPLLVIAAKLPSGETLKERSSRLRQFKFAKQVLDQAMSNPAPGVEGVVTQGLFVFHDENGNFRLSFVYGKAEGTKLVWSTAKRLSFHVQAGEGNKTFRDRMELPWGSFDKLKEVFSVEKLTKEFYNRLFDWYQLALASDEVVFPNDIVKDKDPGEVKSEQLIRLITRLMFVWFLKQKHLMPDDLFAPEKLAGVLKQFDPKRGENYYRVILQNLFFATLNSEIKERDFVVEGSRKENEEHFGVKVLYRYASEFLMPEKEAIKLFEKIPFLNGGLFECLDRDNHYYDGFSRRKSKQARIPNRLFFDEEDGLIPLLRLYNFTVEENSPGDEEVALDPELLGKVFENLLGTYNPETNVAARNATGSFYTPREIVNYMVDESLIAHLMGKCGEEHEETIRKLFTAAERPADEVLCAKMDEALVTAKILDPACGSGAFPMGVLLRMVELLRILRNIPEDQSVHDLKLGLIENCIYGGDIQCIAVQISKLRFFISLVCEQKPTTDSTKNYGINTLPNLETKFVAADSLIGLSKPKKRTADGLAQADMFSEEEDPEIKKLKEDLWDVRHKHFLARSYRQKKELRADDKKLRNLLADTLKTKQGYTADSAEKMAAWDPYDQNVRALFSDPEWMFNVKDGFDIVIGNPPYFVLKSDHPRKVQYEANFPHLKSGRINAYQLFFGSADRLVNQRGIVTYIHPKTLLSDSYLSATRRFLTTKYATFCIVNIVDRKRTFESVLQSVVVSIWIKSSKNDLCRVSEVFQKSDFDAMAYLSIPKRAVVTRDGLLLIAGNLKIYGIVEKAQALAGAPLNFVTGSIEWNKFSDILCDNRQSGGARLVFGENIQRFVFQESRLRAEISFLKKGKYPKIDRMAIITQRTTAVEQPYRIIATIVDPAEYDINLVSENHTNVYYIESKRHALFTLGIINSRFMDFYFRLFNSNTQVASGELNRLPMPIAGEHKQTQIAMLVDRIIAAKKADPATITAKIEEEIDELVYELYGLTDEEKEIVKASVGRGRSSDRTEDSSAPGAVDEMEDGERKSTDSELKTRKTLKKRKPQLPLSLPGWD